MTRPPPATTSAPPGAAVSILPRLYTQYAGVRPAGPVYTPAPHALNSLFAAKKQTPWVLERHSPNLEQFLDQPQRSRVARKRTHLVEGMFFVDKYGSFSRLDTLYSPLPFETFEVMRTSRLCVCFARLGVVVMRCACLVLSCRSVGGFIGGFFVGSCFTLGIGGWYYGRIFGRQWQCPSISVLHRCYELCLSFRGPLCRVSWCCVCRVVCVVVLCVSCRGV